MKEAINPRYYRGFFRLKALLFITLAVAATTLTPSCNEIDTIGLDLIDSRLVVRSTDTISIVAYTQREDSLFAFQADVHLLGIMNDPLFGRTRASIYTEALPRSLPPFIVEIHPDSLIVDSVVFSLQYASYAGDTSLLKRIRIFELDEVIPRDSVYSNRVLRTKQQINVLNPSFQPLPRTNVIFLPDSAVAAPHVRFRIDNSFGRKFILDRPAMQAFTTNDMFREYFKGFMITVEETFYPGAMLYFNLRGANSRFQVFYRKVDNPARYVFELPLGDAFSSNYTSYFNYNHRFVGDPIRTQVLEGDTIQGNERIFVMGMSNFRTKIQLPHISSLMQGQNDDVAINSARLIFPVDESFLPDSTLIPPVLSLVRQNPENPLQLIALEDQFVAQGYFGGVFNRDRMEYVFNITKHLQMILEDPSKNTPLYLRVSGSIQNAGRIVLNGPERDKPLRLEIKYTQPQNSLNN